jgi:DNA topoisomerase VI subunit A
VCRKTAITTRILSLVHELCLKQIHVTKRDLFYTDVKLFEVRMAGWMDGGRLGGWNG